MKIHPRKSNILMCMTVLTILQDIDTAFGAMGGPCISYAQRQCQDEGSNLWIARYDNKLDQICRLFGLYQNCIVSHMSNCDYNDQERELHQTDIVNNFVKSPYNCPFPAKTIGKNNGGDAQRQRNESINYVSNSIMLCVSLLLQKVISFVLS